MIKPKPPRTKPEHRAESTRRLLSVAHGHFAEFGYAGASMETLVESVGMTRGALYHYFGNKEGLFKAVMHEVQRHVALRVEGAKVSTRDPWEQLLAGSRAFLQCCLEPGTRRILLIDGPAVVGWQAWREADAKHSMRLLGECLTALAARDKIRKLSVPVATHLISGALNEAALWVASSANSRRALDEAMQTLEQLLSGLRAPRRTRNSRPVPFRAS